MVKIPLVLVFFQVRGGRSTLNTKPLTIKAKALTPNPIPQPYKPSLSLTVLPKTLA